VGELRIYVRRRTAVLVLDIRSTWRPRPLGRCWLKNVVAHPIDNQNTVAGVKFKIRMD
jgi:hypothetical protein